MKKNSIIVFVLMFMLLTGMIFSNDIKKQVKPSKGNFKFQLNKSWSVEGPDKDEVFGLIVEISVTDSGNVFIRDLKNKKYYAFDKNGKFIKNFGIKGEGPGEVKDTGGASIDVYKNTVIIRDSDKVLYFNDKGDFVRSTRHVGSISLFIDEDNVITAPQSVQGRLNNKAKMKYINLKTKEEKVITDFKIFQSGVINKGRIRASAVIPTITPVMIVGQHDNKIYYGMNNEYKIHVIDLNKKEYSPFMLESKVKTIPQKEKETFMINLIKGIAPDAIAIRIAKTLPDIETYYQNIESYNGNLYVYRSHFIPVNYQNIDIFNSEGKYLYKGTVTVEEDHSIIAGPTIKNNNVFIAVMDEEGEIYLNKYKTELPKN